MKRPLDLANHVSRMVAAGATALVMATLLTACAGSATTPANANATASQTASAPAASPAAVAASPSTAQKVNANSATVPQLQQAFEAAGITNAARWAREVDEYRPYPADDPSFAKLRRELAKYNPGPGVVDQIVATLSL